MSKRSNIKNDRTKTKRADVKRSSVSRIVKKDALKKTGAVKKPKKRFIDYFLKDEAKIEPKNQGKHRQSKEVTKSSVAVKTRPQVKSSKLEAIKKVLAAVILKFRSIKKAYLRAKRNAGTNARKRKLYLSYVGAGTVVVAVTLIFILAPIGQAKDTDVKAANDDTTSAYIAISLLDPEPSPTPIRTTLPEMTRPEAPNTPNVIDNNLDGDGTPTELTPTPTPKPEPPPTPKPDPTPTPKPDSTPTPKPDPTPTPKPDPTPEPTPTPKPTPKYDIDELVKNYKVAADEYYNQRGFSTNYYEYTEDEYMILAQVIHGEAKGETFEGMLAVGNVVMNRVLNRNYFGDNIKAVVVDSGQFSGYSSGITPSSDCKKAARTVLDDQKWVIKQNVYFFKAGGSVGEDWGRNKFYKRIDHHNFYSYNYTGRKNNTEVPPELFKRTYEWPRYGCKPSKDVWRIQSMLAHLGYSVSPDKYFGKGTEVALEKFQEDVGIKADGVAGPTTLTKLINKYGLDKYIADFVE